MEPSSQWVVDYAEDHCALRRAFHAGDNQAILQLRQFGPGDNFEVAVVSDTLSRTSKAPRVRFDPDDEFVEPSAPFFVDHGETHGILYTGSLRPSGLEQSSDWPDAGREARERAVTGLSLAGSFEQNLFLETGSMHEPMNAMRACLDELLTHWGLDAPTQRTLSRMPEPIEAMAWARRAQQSYPMNMLREGKSGKVQIRLMVDVDGKPTSCVTQGGSSDSSFEKHACRVAMRYARFEPALDANGEPVASFFTTAISYHTSP